MSRQSRSTGVARAAARWIGRRVRGLHRAATSRRGLDGRRPPADGRPAYPGDATRLPVLRYAPRPDGEADPGEIVWTWVPFEEDYSQGKDRPVLIIGRDGPWLLGVHLTSKDHDRDEEQERRWGREWVDIGSGPWDPRRRPSEVRVNRLIRVDPAAIRREGAVLARDRWDDVVAGLHRTMG